MTESKATNYIDFELMRKMCHPFAVALFDSTVDPMTKFDEHERALLESALGNPQQTFGGKELYPSLAEKAAILYYSLIKNHPFKNGNKRTATATLLVFLYINDFWLRESEKENNENYLVDLAKRLASSKGDEMQSQFLSEIINWVDKHTV
ncbi:MAG: type II toxin-antitoxin system death-on-curing family toxin [Patescibacteria group bacterium]